MINRLVRKYVPIVGLMATGLYPGMVFADWYSTESQGYYNKKYGDFPPLDIDRRLQQSMSDNGLPEDSQLQNDSSVHITGDNKPGSTAQPIIATQEPRQQSNQYDATKSLSSNSEIKPKKKKKIKKKQSSGVSMPWGNNGSGMSMPWGNNGSGMNMPWSNRGSSFGFPWDNNKNGSSFGFPWDNDKSKFSPWGKQRRHR